MLHFLLKKLNIFILYRFGKAIGDHVCMSAIMEELFQKGYKVIIISTYAEIFYYNPYVWKNLYIDNYPKLIQKLIQKFLDFSKGNRIENFVFQYKNQKIDEYMRKTKAKISLIEAHTLHFKEKLSTTDVKPKIYFSNDEIKKYEEKFHKYQNFAIIQPIGKTTYTPNKEWGFLKYQEVVEQTKDYISWLQIGFKNDKLLLNVEDARGETATLRELAYLISKANFVLANEGLLNHLAASVDTKSFVLFSGFSCVELAQYSTTIAIVKNPQVECAPCWLKEACPKEKKWCTEDISSKEVSSVILEYIQKIKEIK